MTKMEIANFFGINHISPFSAAFRKAEAECLSIKQKQGHWQRNVQVDYTLEESLIAIKYYNQMAESKQYRAHIITPAEIEYFKAKFIHRDTPQYRRPKKLKLNSKQKSFIQYYIYHRKYGGIFKCCDTCAYLSAKQMNREGVKPSPFCNFYNCFLNKVRHGDKPFNIYDDYCDTYEETWEYPIIFTPDGAFSSIKIDLKTCTLKEPTSDMLGIPQSQFKSKRKRGEDIVILKDGFDTD